VTFFQSTRGFRQGCPISPLLFLLVIKGFSRLVLKAKREGNLKGINVSSLHYITHLLFVDDVLIFGDGSAEEWQTYNELIQLFCEELRMKVSSQKSNLLAYGLDDNVIILIQFFYHLLSNLRRRVSGI